MYSYLLNKKEGTSISLAVIVANAKIIDFAYAPNIPVAPKKKITYLAALLLSVLTTKKAILILFLHQMHR